MILHQGVAQVTTDTNNITSLITEFGFPVMFIVLLIAGQIWTNKSYRAQQDRADEAENRERTQTALWQERAERAEKRRDELLETYNSEVLPLLNILIPLMKDLQNRLDEDIEARSKNKGQL